MTAARDFLWIGIGRLLTALVGLAAIRLSTSLLPPSQYGLLTLLVTFQVFCGLFLLNPVAQYIHRNTHGWADNGTLLPKLARFRIWVIISALAGALASGVWAMTQPITVTERILVMASVPLMVVAATWNGTSLWLLNMLGYRAHSVGWGAATVLLGLLLSYALSNLSGSGLAWFAGQAVGMAVGAFGAGIAVRRALPIGKIGRFTLLEPGAVRGYILPLAVATGFMWCLLSGYRLIFEAHWGLVALGYAAVGLMVASQLWGLVETLAMQFLFPLFFRRIASPDRVDASLAFADLLNTLGPVYLVLAAATLVAGPALLALLVNAAYAGVVHFVLLGAVIECCRALGNVLATAAQVNRQMFALVPPYAAGAVSMGAGVMWVAHGGGDIEQAASILAVAGAVTLGVMVLAMQRLQKFHLDLPRWGCGVLMVAAAVVLAWNRPLVPLGVGAALAIVTFAGLVSALSLVGLMWKNPATTRLLAVHLKPDLNQGPPS